jgi:hypothetical protein
MKRFAANLIIALGVIVGVSAQAEARCVPPLRVASPIHGYVTAYVQALSYVDQGLQRMAAPNNDADPVVAFTKMLTDVELAARDYECAAKIFGTTTKNPFSNPRDEVERGQAKLAGTLAGAAGNTFLLLAKNARDLGGVVNQVLGGKLSQAQMPAAMSKIGADTTEALSMLPMLTTAIANLLVDSKPDAAGKLSGLRITQSERNDLVKTIDGFFGDRAKVEFAAGLAYIDSGPVILRRMLTQDGWRLRPDAIDRR